MQTDSLTTGAGSRSATKREKHIAISRQKWGAKGTVPRDPTPKTKLYLHHTVSGIGKVRWTEAEERAHMRMLERDHMKEGWDTIGYSYVLFPTGRLYTGRGPSGLPAAQRKQNSGTIAIALVGNYETQAVTDKQRTRLIKAILNLKKTKRLRTIGGHKQAPGQSTACPGKHIMAEIRTITRKTKLKAL